MKLVTMKRGYGFGAFIQCMCPNWSKHNPCDEDRLDIDSIHVTNIKSLGPEHPNNKLKVEDEITSINGVDVKNQRFIQIIDSLARGTNVFFKFKSKDNSIEVADFTPLKI